MRILSGHWKISVMERCPKELSVLRGSTVHGITAVSAMRSTLLGSRGFFVVYVSKPAFK